MRKDTIFYDLRFRFFDNEDINEHRTSIPFGHHIFTGC